MSLSVTCFGTRGSIPTPGPGTIRFGGNTASLLVESEDARLVVDAGTGARTLGRHLDAMAPVDLTILLSHTHWDHIQGLPFFAPLHAAGNRIQIIGPRQTDGSLAEVLASQMAPAVFPMPLSALGARIEISEIVEARFEVPGFRIESIPLCHPGATLGFSIRGIRGGPVLTYMTDNELGAATAAVRLRFVQALRDTAVLIHDAMYFDDQTRVRAGWGHSSAVQAVELAHDAGVKRLVLFHHDPDHDDDAIERLGAEAFAAVVRLGADLDVTIAAEGRSIRC